MTDESIIDKNRTDRTNEQQNTYKKASRVRSMVRSLRFADWLVLRGNQTFSDKKKRKSAKQRKTEQNNKKQRDELKGEMKKNEETNKHLEDHRTKKRTPTNKTTDRISDRPPDRPTEQPTDQPTEETNNRGNYALKEQTNKIPTDRTKKRDKKRVTDPMHGQKDTEKNEQMNESEQNK